MYDTLTRSFPFVAKGGRMGDASFTCIIVVFGECGDGGGGGMKTARGVRAVGQISRHGFRRETRITKYVMMSDGSTP